MAAADGLSPKQWDATESHRMAGLDDDEVNTRQRIVSIAVGSRHVEFKNQPVQEFHPQDLIPTQRWLYKEKHDALREKAGTELPPIDVVRTHGLNYVRDGHHRLDLAAERGQKIRAHVLNADAPWSSIR